MSQAHSEPRDRFRSRTDPCHLWHSMNHQTLYGWCVRPSHAHRVGTPTIDNAREDCGVSNQSDVIVDEMAKLYAPQVPTKAPTLPTAAANP